MDFTREPVVESIITPRDGFRIVVRSSKNVGHEEYFVDALEIIVFGGAVFFRSNEKPKPFLVPSSDYEVFEVREPRIALKTPSIEGTVRITSTKEPVQKVAKETPPQPQIRTTFPPQEEKVKEERGKEEKVKEEKFPLLPRADEIEAHQPENVSSIEIAGSAISEVQQEKKRDKRNRYKKRKGLREESHGVKETTSSEQEALEKSVNVDESKKEEGIPPVRTLLPPPTTLIRDDIERLRKDDTFKGAFFIRDDRVTEREEDDDDAPVVPKRLIFDEEDSSEADSSDAFKATPAKASVKEVREPFWIPPPSTSEVKQPE